MKRLYAKEALPPDVAYQSSIFLAGPTPRDPQTPSWRPEACRLLEERQYDGWVFLPEERDGKWKGNYLDQVTWERQMRERADVILFWVPRELARMPAFTTNVEFGEDYDTHKMVYGRPPQAPKTRYLDALYEGFARKPPCETLEATIEDTLALLDGGAHRQGGETCIPLHIWRTTSFQAWYAQQRAHHNRIEDAQLLWSYPPRTDQPVFSFSIQLKLWLQAEGRHKSNEFLFARPDIAAVVAYAREASRPLEETQFLLVQEFRTPCRNPHGLVLECPGGSSPEESLTPRQLAAIEFTEETGIPIEAKALQPLGQRQLCATLSSHHAHLFALPLTQDQLALAQQRIQQQTHAGNTEDSERTYPILCTFSDLLARKDLDWATLGMLAQAIHS